MTCKCSLLAASVETAKIQYFVCGKCGTVYVKGRSGLVSLNATIRQFPSVVDSITGEIKKQYRRRVWRHANDVLNCV